MQNGKQSAPKDDDRLNGLAKSDRTTIVKFTRRIDASTILEKQKAIVARQGLIARIEQLKADIEEKKLELIELKEKLKDL